MAVLVDSNVLLFSIQRGHEWQDEAIEALKTLLVQDVPVCILLQNIAEFWNVCTRPTHKNGLGLGVRETEAWVETLESILTIVHDPAAVYGEWRTLIARYDVKGIQVHDARIAASMRVHGITRILTYNPNDFKRYEWIAAVHPKDVM